MTAALSASLCFHGQPHAQYPVPYAPPPMPAGQRLPGREPRAGGKETPVDSTLGSQLQEWPTPQNPNNTGQVNLRLS